jgi:DNA polymerase III delta prime subunit
MSKTKQELVAWEEKERPKFLKDIIDVSGNIKLMQRHINEGIRRSYLLSGPPGTGKTTAAWAYAREWLVKMTAHLNINVKDLLGSNIKEFNASDERGIDTIRGLKRYLTKPGYWVIILDEADSLTPDAQHALRNMMETAKKNKVSPKMFILTCNYPKKIIDALHSRCEVLNFNRIPFDPAKKHLIKIARKNGFDDVTWPSGVISKEDRREVFNDFWDSIYDLSKGDMRIAISLTQNYAKNGKIDMSEPPVSFAANEFKIVLDECLKPLKEENSYATFYAAVDGLINNPDKKNSWNYDDFIEATREWIIEWKSIGQILSHQLGVLVSKYAFQLSFTNEIVGQLASMMSEMRLAVLISALKTS